MVYVITGDGAVRQLRHRLGSDLFDEVVQAGWSNSGRGEREGHCLASDFARL